MADLVDPSLPPAAPPPSSSSSSALPTRAETVRVVKEGISMSTWYLAAMVLLCIFMVLATLVGGLVPRPANEPNPADKIIGYMTPVIMALLAGALYGQNRSMNGRLSELQRVGETAALKQGRAAALQGMMWRLQTMDPQSEAYKTLSEQILQETMIQSGVVERRRTNGYATDRAPTEE